MPPIKPPGTPLTSIAGQLLPTLTQQAVGSTPQQVRTQRTSHEMHEQWLRKRERDAEKKRLKYFNSPLPTYDSVTDIKYADFVRRLKNINESDGEMDRETVERALRQYFVDVYGQRQVDGFDHMYDREANHPGLAAWSRLRDEATWYWKRH